MTPARKQLWLTLAPLALVLLTGCGGFTASPSVSPLMFLVPGLGRLESEPAQRRRAVNLGANPALPVSVSREDAPEDQSESCLLDCGAPHKAQSDSRRPAV